MEEVEQNNTDESISVEQVEVNNEENQATRPPYVEKSTMPITRNYMVMKAFKGIDMKKFNSPHNKQDVNKRDAIKKRSRRLKKIGWNLMYFSS